MTLRNEIAASDDLRASAIVSKNPSYCARVSLAEMVTLFEKQAEAWGTSTVIFAEDFTREHSGGRSHPEVTEIAGIF